MTAEIPPDAGSADDLPLDLADRLLQIATDALGVGEGDESAVAGGRLPARAGGSASGKVLWQAEPFDPSKGNAPVLTCGLPWRGTEADPCDAKQRLIWWPSGIPDRYRIGIASSRVSRRLDLHPRWFDLLRTAVMRVDADRECLCVVDNTAAAKAVSRAARLLNRPQLRVQISEARCGQTLPIAADALKQWLSECIGLYRMQFARREDEAACSEGPCPEWRALISPPVQGTAQDTGDGLSCVVDTVAMHVPFRDHLQLLLCDRLYVLECRVGGHLERLIEHHLKQLRTSCPSSDAFPLIHLAKESLTPSISEAVTAGSPLVYWIVGPPGDRQDQPACDEAQQQICSLEHSQERTAESSARRSVDSLAEARSDPISSPGDWLLHWTRAHPAAWPGQAEEDWLDELILGCSTADRSAVAALLRIAADRRIRASSQGIRGGWQVVAFTAVPLFEFRRRRVFRRHRHRYDFEPWGVAIRRRVLERHGVRPVCYGDDTDWGRMPEIDRPWFQKATAGNGPTNNVAEQEWRCVGDVLFDDAADADICFFVDTPHEAELLSKQTPYSVVVVPQQPQDRVQSSSG